MEYDKINLKVVIKGEIFAIPCSIAITPDGDKLILVFKEDNTGAVRELRNKLVSEGEKLE